MRHPTRPLLFALALCTAVAAVAAEAPGSSPITGFSTASGLAQRALESRFDALLDPALLRTWMQHLSAHPHHVGSPWGKQNAEFMAELFRSWGYETRIEVFHVLFPTPKTRVLEMTSPRRFTAPLSEPALAADATSDQTAEQLPTYNVYSADGDVTAELVYVNRGVPADYEELERRGISVQGKIVIARYGGSWRGIKPKVAAEHGAIGCIIYSDPSDDGYTQGDVYPKGGWRGERSAQRGSVSDGPAQYTGDPLTPGVAATENAVRLPLDKATTLTKIPVLPISYADALPLLSALGGAVVPESWRGALPIAYHFGPGPATVHLALAFHWDLQPIYNVIATLPGAELPNQWVLRGNHHDAWVNGATDPVSGMVALLAEARAVGQLAKEGSRPRRTLVYAAWDGEEPGLLGSSEWVEAHLEELRAKAVAYINSDSNSRGFLSAGGSHTLERLVNEVAADVVDPVRKVSVGERARALLRSRNDVDAKRAELRLYPLGSGSDYTPFLQHAGIASLNLDYGGEEDYGQYHSIYDSFAHYVRFMDPTFEYGVTEAKTAGRVVLRLANADILPFAFAPFADNVQSFATEVMRLADTQRDETASRNERIADRTFELAADSRLPFVTPIPKTPVPHLNFAPLENALVRLVAAAKTYDQAATSHLGGSQPLDSAQAQQLDRILLGAEHALTRSQGLPQRPWYQHHLYAPGRYTGYSVKTLPGIREAIEERRYAEAEAQIAIAADVLQTFSAEIERATTLLRPASVP
jgi:N-acetylated-alpha-linked acidic dipeptidase